MWGPRVRSGKKKKKREAEAVLGSKRKQAGYKGPTTARLGFCLLGPAAWFVMRQAGSAPWIGSRTYQGGSGSPLRGSIQLVGLQG